MATRSAIRRRAEWPKRGTSSRSDGGLGLVHFDQPCCDARGLDSVDFGQCRAALREGQRLSSLQHVSGMMLEDPAAELTPDVGFTHPLDHLDPGGAEHANPLAVDAR